MLVTGFACAVSALVLLRASVAHRRDAVRRDAMRADLTRLVIAQDSAYDVLGRFVLVGAGYDADAIAFRLTNDGVALRTRTTGRDGWSAVLSDGEVLSDPRNCGIFIGEPKASPHRALVVAGRATCW